MEDVPKATEPPANAIQFAAWPTPVDNDDLTLVSLQFGNLSEKIDYVAEGFSLQITEDHSHDMNALEAVFLSLEKRAAVVFKFSSVNAFRVLDEHGLTDMWAASKSSARPARTTFRVKGHKWQDESFLSWASTGTDYSFMIATGWDCLEVVSFSEPVIEIIPAIVKDLAKETKH